MTGAVVGVACAWMNLYICLACGCLIIARTFECLIDSSVVVALCVVVCVLATTVG